MAHSNESGMSIITVILNADNTDTDDYARFTATNDLLNYVSIIGKARPIAKKGQATRVKSQAPVLELGNLSKSLLLLSLTLISSKK